jgi:hypothetical protein
MIAWQGYNLEELAMKETTPVAMPPCFDRWCQRFDDIFSHQAQKREFRNYLGGLWGESERKTLPRWPKTL